ncbi:MAG: hypothetical protein ABUK08_00345 [Candidatus Humimicrobiaceae bacterium]
MINMSEVYELSDKEKSGILAELDINTCFARLEVLKNHIDLLRALHKTNNCIIKDRKKQIARNIAAIVFLIEADKLVSEFE